MWKVYVEGEMITRDLPQRLFDNHVNNVTLYRVDAKP